MPALWKSPMRDMQWIFLLLCHGHNENCPFLHPFFPAFAQHERSFGKECWTKKRPWAPGSVCRVWMYNWWPDIPLDDSILSNHAGTVRFCESRYVFVSAYAWKRASELKSWQSLGIWRGKVWKSSWGYGHRHADSCLKSSFSFPTVLLLWTVESSSLELSNLVPYTNFCR